MRSRYAMRLSRNELIDMLDVDKGVIMRLTHVIHAHDIREENIGDLYYQYFDDGPIWAEIIFRKVCIDESGRTLPLIITVLNRTEPWFYYDGDFHREPQCDRGAK